MIINRILGLLAITILIAGVVLGLMVIPGMLPVEISLAHWDEAAMEVLICHQTGSSANPWRPMKVTPAEASHYLAAGDLLADRDGRCPAESGHPSKGNVDICHYTGHKDEAWVRLSISPGRLGRYGSGGATLFEGNCP